MTIKQLLMQLTDSNANLIESRNVTLEIDCDSDARLVSPHEVLVEALSSLLQFAIECSPVGGRVSVSSVATSRGTEIEIADNSDLTADTAREGAFVIAKAERDLRKVGVQLHLLNCAQGGVAYSMALPKATTAAA